MECHISQLVTRPPFFQIPTTEQCPNAPEGTWCHILKLHFPYLLDQCQKTDSPDFAAHWFLTGYDLEGLYVQKIYTLPRLHLHVKATAAIPKLYVLPPQPRCVSLFLLLQAPHSHLCTPQPSKFLSCSVGSLLDLHTDHQQQQQQ